MAAPRKDWPWVTIAIVALNVAVFGWELAAGADPLQPTAQWMVDHGGNFAPETFAGGEWRLLTSMFLHYGLLHIAMNMIGLLDGGRHVERMYGRAGFVALYLVSGLAGSLASAMHSPNVASAGASGAIFGVFGAFGGFLFVHRAKLDVDVVQRQVRGLAIFLAYNVYFGLTAKGIDLVAHLGGLLAGFGLGVTLGYGAPIGRASLRRAVLVGAIGTAVVFGIAFFAPRPADPLGDFVTVESKVLARWNQVVPQVGTLTDDQLADVIDHELVPPWHAAGDHYAEEAAGPLRTDMLAYIAAREDGWAMMSKALRVHDTEGVKAGMARFKEADAILQRVNAGAK